MARAAVLTLAGVWLGVLFASWAMAGASFRAAEAVAAATPGSPAGDRVALVPADGRRPLFRHLASEINRWMFARFGWAQLALAVVVVAFTWGTGGAPRALAVGAAVVVMAQAVGLGPAILELGRSVDFVARPLAPDVGRRFAVLHGGYVVLDLVKAILLVALTVLVARRGA